MDFSTVISLIQLWPEKSRRVFALNPNTISKAARHNRDSQLAAQRRGAIQRASDFRNKNEHGDSASAVIYNI